MILPVLVLFLTHNPDQIATSEPRRAKVTQAPFAREGCNPTAAPANPDLRPVSARVNSCCATLPPAIGQAPILSQPLTSPGYSYAAQFSSMLLTFSVLQDQAVTAALLYCPLAVVRDGVSCFRIGRGNATSNFPTQAFEHPPFWDLYKGLDRPKPHRMAFGLVDT
jgi:hypothetical protein